MEIAEGPHGCLQVTFSAERRIGWTARVGRWPFVTGSGRGRTFAEAADRAIRQFHRRYSQVRFVSDEGLANI